MRSEQMKMNTFDYSINSDFLYRKWIIRLPVRYWLFDCICYALPPSRDAHAQKLRSRWQVITNAALCFSTFLLLQCKSLIFQNPLDQMIYSSCLSKEFKIEVEMNKFQNLFFNKSLHRCNLFHISLSLF